MAEMTKESIVEELKKLIKKFEEGTFEGVLLYTNSEGKEGWMQSVKGNAEDRLMLVDIAIMSMRNEPNQDTRNWFFTQLSNRLSMLIPRQQKDMVV